MCQPARVSIGRKRCGCGVKFGCVSADNPGVTATTTSRPARGDAYATRTGDTRRVVFPASRAPWYGYTVIETATDQRNRSTSARMSLATRLSVARSTRTVRHALVSVLDTSRPPG